MQADGIFMLTAYTQITASALQVSYCFSSVGIPETAQLLYTTIAHRTTDQAAISNDKCAAAMFEASRKMSQERFALSNLVDSQLLTSWLCRSAEVLGGVC